MRSEQILNRLIATLILFLIFCSIIFATLINLQIFDSGKYKEKALSQYQKVIDIHGKRGLIYDRQGNKLATNNLVKSFYVVAEKINNREFVANKIAPLVEKNKGTLLKNFEQSPEFCWLARKVSLEKADTIKKVVDKYNFKGIEAIDRYRRFYPYQQYGAQVIGYTDIDNCGLAGSELKYNTLLSGEKGSAKLFIDAKGNKYPVFHYAGNPPKDGSDIYLTLDISLQTIVEEKLKEGVEEMEARSGRAIFIEPHSGEILAMASYPNFNPNQLSKSSEKSRKNRIITDVYEPGSVFKLVTATAYLEEFYPCDLTKKIDCGGGELNLYNHTIHDVHPYDSLTIRKVFINSSNIGTIKLAKKVGREKIYQQAKEFAFGSKTGVDLPGEVSGVVKEPKRWSGLTIGAFPIGQEVTITPLQLACAYAAVANGGYLLKPYVARKFHRPDGPTTKRDESSIIRRVIKKEHVKVLQGIFRDVVKEGTGKSVQIDGIPIAGKTGTAQIPSPSGGYHPDRIYGTFVGYAPANNPSLLGVVTVNSPPHWENRFGGLSAGPIFREIMKEAFLSSSPSLIAKTLHHDQDSAQQSKTEDTLVSCPNLIKSSRKEIREVLQSKSLCPKFLGKGNIAYAQNPKPYSQTRKGDSIAIHLTDSVSYFKSKRAEVPNLKGLTIREAINYLSSLDIRVKIMGSGKVVEQNPKPGKLIKKNKHCLLICKK